MSVMQRKICFQPSFFSISTWQKPMLASSVKNAVAFFKDPMRLSIRCMKHKYHFSTALSLLQGIQNCILSIFFGVKTMGAAHLVFVWLYGLLFKHFIHFINFKLPLFKVRPVWLWVDG